MTANLVVRRVRIDRLDGLPERLKAGAGGRSRTAQLHVGPLSVKDGRQVGVQIVQDRTSGWWRQTIAEDRDAMQAGAFAVNRLRCDIVIGPDVVENEGQQYGKNYAELQENGISNFVLAAKRVTVNDPVQQHASDSRHQPGPDDQSAKFSIGHRLKGQREFGIAFSILCKRRQGDAEQANASRDRKERFEQCAADLFELASSLDLRLTGAASRDHPEIGELYLECDRASASSRSLAVRPHLVDDLAKRLSRGLVREEIGGKRVLGAERFAYPIGPDGTLVDAARRPVIVGAGLPEMLLQEGLRLRP